MFSNDIKRIFKEIKKLALHTDCFLQQLSKKYSGGIKRDCADSIFYILEYEIYYIF